MGQRAYTGGRTTTGAPTPATTAGPLTAREEDRIRHLHDLDEARWHEDQLDADLAAEKWPAGWRLEKAA